MRCNAWMPRPHEVFSIGRTRPPHCGVRSLSKRSTGKAFSRARHSSLILTSQHIVFFAPLTFARSTLEMPIKKSNGMTTHVLRFEMKTLLHCRNTEEGGEEAVFWGIVDRRTACKTRSTDVRAHRRTRTAWMRLRTSMCSSQTMLKHIRLYPESSTFGCLSPECT
ncbi:hypothetical protein BU26DRAFT_86891 [Trematosphaeria pertusa]|uniref:Uncharacterized protein n=1 Tax=Trematosphaeria pertusa TaxID=390896 RepID=A0A6A6I3E7_9PLEO|nr:uncharacterized protein BU26DRAFT_86891 [Trematosphaeria pertusa]KAF2244806.1 hypothetical protein BU26DRAFT_86891 [Trematosphaeria pertusa]